MFVAEVVQELGFASLAAVGFACFVPQHFGGMLVDRQAVELPSLMAGMVTHPGHEVVRGWKYLGACLDS